MQRAIHSRFNLVSLQKKDIMTAKINYLKGDKINGVTFICNVEPHILPNGRKIRKSKFECVCGNQFDSIAMSVKSGRTKSCGCLKNERISELNKKHGYWNDNLYKTWLSQKSRCLNPKATGYKHWGGRGIKFSEEFLDINIWMDYVKSLPNYENRESKKLTLDRIDNDGHYEKGNLRWIDRSTQNKNRRKNDSY